MDQKNEKKSPSVSSVSVIYSWKIVKVNEIKGTVSGLIYMILNLGTAFFKVISYP